MNLEDVSKREILDFKKFRSKVIIKAQLEVTIKIAIIKYGRLRTLNSKTLIAIIIAIGIAIVET